MTFSNDISSTKRQHWCFSMLQLLFTSGSCFFFSQFLLFLGFTSVFASLSTKIYFLLSELFDTCKKRSFMDGQFFFQSNLEITYSIDNQCSNTHVALKSNYWLAMTFNSLGNIINSKERVQQVNWLFKYA